jgi:hypothetical protein
MHKEKLGNDKKGEAIEKRKPKKVEFWKRWVDVKDAEKQTKE